MSIARKGKCIHFTGCGDNACCAAGVNYKELAGEPHDGWMRRLPCHIPEYKSYGRMSLPVSEVKVCEKRQEPTPEQIAESDRLIQESYGRTKKARSAIVEHLGGPWKSGKPSASGTIDCPVCGKKESLWFSRSGFNGHIHAMCDDCVSWME